jgi:hypothetical protein
MGERGEGGGPGGVGVEDGVGLHGSLGVLVPSFLDNFFSKVLDGC